MFFILSLMAIGQVGLDLYAPSMPAMSHSLGVSGGSVQLSMTLYLLAGCLSPLFFGPLSDCYGRKPTLLFGVSLFCLASVLVVFSDSITLLLIGRIFQGLGIGLSTGLSRAIARDLYSKDKGLAKISSYQSMAWTTATLASPLIGGYIQQYLGWRMNFITMLGFGILMLLLIVLKFKETHSKELRHKFAMKTILNNYKTILSNKTYIGSALAMIITFSTALAIIQLGPFLFQNLLHISASNYGWLPFVLGIIGIIGASLNIRFIRFMKINHIILFALVFIIIAYTAGFTLVEFGLFSLVAVLIPLLFARVFSSMVYANSMTNAMNSFSNMSGTAGSILASLILLGGSFSSFTLSRLPQHSSLTLFTSLVVFALIGLIAFLFLVYRAKSHQAKPQSA